MKNIKDELQHIILGDEPTGQTSHLKKIQRFLRSNAETSFATEKQQRLKSEETALLIAFAEQNDIIYTPEIRESDFISEGAEQKVYRLKIAYLEVSIDSELSYICVDGGALNDNLSALKNRIL